ncbi:MAG: DUF2784 domain-containing protein [Desulfobacterales bacterium]|nr:DUF2784 domain-containing protein [Desulfobacterales bacterium]
MEPKLFYLLAADIILLVHVLFVLFLVVGLGLILAGKLKSWSWVYNFWFRLAHLLGIIIVTIQSWVGVICPLTTFEMALRSKAGETVYAGSFISFWLKKLIYYQAPEWVFILCYTGFGVLVVLSWIWVAPRFPKKF